MRPSNHLTQTRCCLSWYCCSVHTVEVRFMRARSKGRLDKVSILYAKCLLNNNVIASTQIK